jgi:hypothetical protein
LNLADSPDSQADAVVADGDRGGLLVGSHGHHDPLLSAWSIAFVTRLRTIRSGGVVGLRDAETRARAPPRCCAARQRPRAVDHAAYGIGG